MSEKDFDEIRKVQMAAWIDYSAGIGQPRKIKPRTDLSLKSYQKGDPEGCFVAKDGEKIVGSIFSHTWGIVGWFGPFEVLPEYQNKGIGRMLIDASLAYLQKSGCETIGLETMPESKKNLQLYIKYGFWPVGLTIIMSKILTERRDAEVKKAGTEFRVFDLSETEKAAALKAIRRISNSTHHGLDYTKEIIIAERYELGKTLLLTKGKMIVGFALLYTYPIVEGLERATVRILVIESRHASEEAFFTLLSKCERTAEKAGKKEISLGFYSCSGVPIRSLLSAGYPIAVCLVRMILKGETGEADALHFSRWSG